MSTITIKSQSMRPTRVRALVLVGCVLGIGSSMAQAVTTTEDVPSVTVQYSALDLTSDDGARILYRRIASAAQAVCPAADPRDLNGFARSKSCRSEAIARAVRDIHSPRLAALYSARITRG
jgi:UrcA family protein